MKARDLALASGFWLAAGCAVATVAAIAFVLIAEALPAIAAIGVTRFMSDASWHPTVELFNVTPMFVGTMATAAGGLLIATMLGVATAIFCCFFAGAMERPFQRILQLMAGIPSVVYGFWGLVVLVPAINRIHPPGASLLAGALILGMMVLPTIALLSLVSLRATPSEYIAGARALGLSQWTIATRIALPAARKGVATAIVIGSGRALGETMAVMMVTGNVVQTPSSMFDPVRTLSANIALEIGYAGSLHRSALFVSALALAILVAMLTVATSSIDGRARDRDD